MAGRDIKVNFVSDAKQVVTDVDRMTDALEDGADALVKLGREGDKVGSKVGDDLKDGVRDGTRSAERDLDSMADDLRLLAREGKRTGDSVGDDISDGMDRGRESAQSLKEEAIANISEVASSTSGDMSDLGDAIQGTLGGLAASIPGPVGLAAAGVAAILGGALASFNANAEAQKEATQEIFDSMVENGVAALNDLDLAGRLSEALKDDEAVRTAKDAADALGISFDTAIAAIAGYPDAIDEVNTATDKFKEKQDALYLDTGEILTGAGSVEQLGIRIDNTASSLDDAADKYGTYAAAQRKYSDDGIADAKRQQDAETQRFENLANLDRAARDKAPITIPVDVQVPDMDKVRRDLQARFTAGGKRLTIVADVADRYGSKIG